MSRAEAGKGISAWRDESAQITNRALYVEITHNGFARLLQSHLSIWRGITYDNSAFAAWPITPVGEKLQKAEDFRLAVTATKLHVIGSE